MSVFCAPFRLVDVRGFGALVVSVSGRSLLHITTMTGLQFAIKHTPRISLEICSGGASLGGNLQNWDAGCHDCDGRLGERPDCEVDTVIRDICARHANNHDRFDDATYTGTVSKVSLCSSTEFILSASYMAPKLIATATPIFSRRSIDMAIKIFHGRKANTKSRIDE